MDFWKFEDTLKTSALYFSRMDLLKDPFEGRFAEGNAVSFSDSDRAFNEAYKLKRTLEEAKQQHETHRRCSFVSCWHRNAHESADMWRAYTAGADSVVVVSSAKALYSFVPKAIMKSPVEYHRQDFARSELGWSTFSIFKPASYGFEREFRMLRGLEEGDSVPFDDPKDFGRHVSVRLKKIVRRVITHPRATTEFKARVDSALAMHLKFIRRDDSRLRI